MRTMLFTGWDAAYTSLAALTVPLMEEYAIRHGYTFREYRNPIIKVRNGIYWTGVCGALKALRDGYDRAIYLDADQQITNFDYELPGWWGGFHVSRDWGEDATSPLHFSACGFAAHPDCIDFLQGVLDMEPEWRDKPFPEQAPLREAGSKFKWINLHPRKLFNCVPDRVCPGKVPEPWQKGDWCAHLTMLSIPERVKLFHEIQRQL